MKNDLSAELHVKRRSNEGASLKFYERMGEVDRREFRKAVSVEFVLCT